MNNKIKATVAMVLAIGGMLGFAWLATYQTQILIGIIYAAVATVVCWLAWTVSYDYFNAKDRLRELDGKGKEGR